MPAYRVYCPLCPELRAVLLEAASGFEARQLFASWHTAMRASDVVAIRIWEEPDEPEAVED